MTDAEFMSMMQDMQKYLETPKVFVHNPDRIAEVRRATEIAREIFPDAEIDVKHDPLQLGSMVLTVQGFDITANTKREIELFSEMVATADNFEVYPIGDENVKLAVMFNRALTRIKGNTDL